MPGKHGMTKNEKSMPKNEKGMPKNYNGAPKLSEKQAKHIDTNKDGKISGADFPINKNRAPRRVIFFQGLGPPLLMKTCLKTLFLLKSWDSNHSTAGAQIHLFKDPRAAKRTQKDAWDICQGLFAKHQCGTQKSNRICIGLHVCLDL